MNQKEEKNEDLEKDNSNNNKNKTEINDEKTLDEITLNSENDNIDIETENNEDSKREIELLKEEKIRLLAEMENLRKRFEREKVETIKFGSINLARDILSPADNLERALSALPEKEEYSQNIKNLVEGLKMVLKEFKNILERHGVKKIETIDKKFDHNFHQAMMEIEREDVDEGTVVQEVQSGYIMHDRLLRAAMVGVSKKSTNNEDVDKNNNNNEEMADKSD